MPSPVSGNSNTACVMIGEKGADLVKEDYSRIETFNLKGEIIDLKDGF